MNFWALEAMQQAELSQNPGASPRAKKGKKLFPVHCFQLAVGFARRNIHLNLSTGAVQDNALV